MTYRPAQRKTAGRRNPKHCRCQVDARPPEWHAKRRHGKRQLNTQHAALHLADCPHSELAITTARSTPRDRRKARRLKG